MINLVHHTQMLWMLRPCTKYPRHKSQQECGRQQGTQKCTPVAASFELYGSGGDTTCEKVARSGARPTWRDGSGDADFATGGSKSTWRWQTPSGTEMFPIRGLPALPPEQKKARGAIAARVCLAA